MKTFFHVLDIKYAGDLLFSAIDDKGEVLKHPEAMQQAFEAGRKFATEIAGH
ncbi:MAG: hypothetical protein HY663_03065 [Chloroflexi bacterium]|nr:hypothetical protein [Chloroflexota bacterium]